MSQPRYRYRIYILTVLVLVGCGVLMTQLYDFQIERQDEFRKQVPSNYEVRVREPGVRGEITDRNAVVLAKNNLNFQLVFNLKEIHQDYLVQFKEKHKNTDPSERPPAPGIVEIINSWVRPKLAEQKIDAKYSATALETHYKTHSGLVPYVFRDDLTYNQFAHFAEHNLELPGVSVRVSPRREYPYGSLASHILGYLKQWEKGDISEEFKHFTGDPKGISGIEATMDDYLRGSEGVRTVLKNEKGKNLRDVDYLKPAQGSKVELSIDAKAQYLTETVLRRAGRAAAVVMDPRTGEVLAMASVPDFDPNDFIPNISSKRYAYYRDNKSAPFINRAISNFPPGSTFKIATAIAGCLNGQYATRCNCIGYTPYGKARIRCWNHSGHGTLGLAEALQRSCNPFFMNIANTLGSDKMAATFSMLGLGEQTNIRLPKESSGIVPGSPQWSRLSRKNNITPALNGMLSLGQGDSEASPLQLAALVSAVANGGKLYQPRIVREVSHPDLGIQIANRPKLRVDLSQKGLKPEHIATIRDGMYRAAHQSGGTASKAAPDGIKIGAKTGTAQTSDLGIRTHVAWTVAFAPYDDPRYVVVVAVKRGGSGGKVAGPLVKLILTGLFAQENGQELPLAKQSPYIGNTDLIAEITLPQENPLAAAFAADGETGDEASSIIVIKTAPDPSDTPLPKPTIRAEIDRRGSVIPRAIPVAE